MKILRLNMLAFGPFSGQVLDFDKANATFHVVYGSNEAGKSSSLRALRQCLYGIPHNSTDNFIHANPNLRIGGVLQDSQGKQLEFIRRKGRDKTLRGADDVQVVEPAEIARMLGGVDEASFCQRFGIGYEELREGGRAIVDGGGELGAILFAAGAGIADIRQVQSRIEAELQELFKSGGSNPRINKAIADLKVVRDQIKEAQLPTSRWVDEDKSLKAAKKRQAATDRDLLEKRAKKSRLERLIKAQPLLATRKHWLQQQATVADVPVLSDDFTSNRREALVNLANALQSKEEATQEIEKLRAAIAEVKIPEALLERRSAILHLHSGLGSYQKAAKDRPVLTAQKRQLDENASQVLKDLGREPNLENTDQLRLTKLQRQRIQELAAECKSRFDKHTSAEAAGRKLVSHIESAEKIVAGLQVSRNADGLKQAIRQSQQHGPLDHQINDTQTSLRELETAVQVELKQLTLFRGTLDELEQMPICESETIDRFENDFVDANSAIRKIDERIEELTLKLQAIDGQLEALRLAHDVPTEVDLSEARSHRDGGWQLVRRSLTAGDATLDPTVAAFVEQFAVGTDLSQAFQVSIEKADVVADRLRHEADRVAEKAALTADRSERSEQLLKEKETLAQAKAQLATLQSQWREHWSSLNSDPLPPREMRPWLRRRNSLAEKAQGIRNKTTVIADKSKLLESLRSALSKQLAQLDQAPPSVGNSLAELVALSETAVNSIEAANRKRDEGEQKLLELRAELVESQETVAQAASDLQKWQSGWAEAVAAVGMTESATPSEANSVIQSVDELLAELKESSSLVHRIAGIDRDAKVFKDEVHTLVAAVASDLAELSVDLAVSDLSDRLSAATSAQARLDEWKDQLRDEESKHDKSRLAVDRWQTSLDLMCKTAKCTGVDVLPEIEQRSALHRKSKEALDSVMERLVALASGEPIEAFIKDAEEASPEEMQTELQQLVNDIHELDRIKTEIAEAIGGHQTELKRMDGNGRAAEAQAHVEHLLAVIRNDADQYIRLRLAATVLKRSIERFRENSQGPVVDRAGAIFADMTLGAFSGLRADYDEKGKAALVGVRASTGQSVSVDGMSDGTCDQLYLALRLALLESALSDHEPIPFIVDDILIQFDDDRAVASLKSLAKLSKKTQVIFFTHHEHLVELARKHVDANVQFTHRLNSSTCFQVRVVN
jgi:uncharacterized protein YhaN